MRGNCYVTSEALFHLMGGKDAGWQAMRMRWEDDTRWFLKNVRTGQIVDATFKQFKQQPDYSLAIGTGFLTKEPSKRAAAMMEKMLWQVEEKGA